jgi:hypothetical protein
LDTTAETVIMPSAAPAGGVGVGEAPHYLLFYLEMELAAASGDKLPALRFKNIKYWLKLVLRLPI